MAFIRYLTTLKTRIGGAFLRGLRDILFLLGLGLFGYGLYIFTPWISFTVCGAILMIVGWAMQEKPGGSR